MKTKTIGVVVLVLWVVIGSFMVSGCNEQGGAKVSGSAGTSGTTQATTESTQTQK